MQNPLEVWENEQLDMPRHRQGAPTVLLSSPPTYTVGGMVLVWLCLRASDRASRGSSEQAPFDRRAGAPPDRLVRGQVQLNGVNRQVGVGCPCRNVVAFVWRGVATRGPGRVDDRRPRFGAAVAITRLN